GDRVGGVVAAHYVDALQADPDAADAGEIRETAREMLVRAGERAASLGGDAEAQRSHLRAAALCNDPPLEAELDERAGAMARVGARVEESLPHFELAISLFEGAGERHAVARGQARVAPAGGGL